jgi:dolichol-phosphate mannosyltransferase
MPEHNRYFPGLRAYAGFKQRGIEVRRDPRYAGTSRVGLAGLIRLACNAIFSFSYVPIRVISLIGFSVASLAFLYILVIAYKKFISHEAILGWASTLGAVLFIGGLQVLMLGIVAEYIGRIYEETKQRPQYIVAELRNFESHHESQEEKSESALEL